MKACCELPAATWTLEISSPIANQQLWREVRRTLHRQSRQNEVHHPPETAPHSLREILESERRHAYWAIPVPFVDPETLQFPRVLSLGRALSNDIVLADTSVSKVHARIDESGNHYRVTDLGSKNGIVVNGHTIAPHAPVPLALESTLELGRVQATVRSVADAMRMLFSYLSVSE